MRAPTLIFELLARRFAQGVGNPDRDVIGSEEDRGGTQCSRGAYGPLLGRCRAIRVVTLPRRQRSHGHGDGLRPSPLALRAGDPWPAAVSGPLDQVVIVSH